MKKIMLSLIMFIAIISICFSNQTYAMGNITQDGDSFINIGKQEYANNKPLDEGALQVTSKEIYNLLFTLAVVLAFGVGLIIGIQFITGSVDEKAKIKETLIPYVVGCIVVFSAFTIWKIVIEVGNSMEGTAKAESIKVAEIKEENDKVFNIFLKD